MFLFVLYLFVSPITVRAIFQDDTGAKRLAFIQQLHICENRFNVPRIVDTNGYYSYKFLMFQRSTFDRFGGKYGLPHDDIYNDDQQAMIAMFMLNDGLWTNWYTCAKQTTKKLGYSYPVDI